MNIDLKSLIIGILTIIVIFLATILIMGPSRGSDRHQELLNYRELSDYDYMREKFGPRGHMWDKEYYREGAPSRYHQGPKYRHPWHRGDDCER